MDDFRSRVERERPYLLRYASLQLRDTQAAEDAVQDTLLAALAGESGFGQRASLRTWLTGILKHKIIDAIRRTSRENARVRPVRRAAVLGTGVVLLFTGESSHRFDAPKRKAASNRQSLALLPGPGQFGLALGGAF